MTEIRCLEVVCRSDLPRVVQRVKMHQYPSESDIKQPNFPYRRPTPMCRHIRFDDARQMLGTKHHWNPLVSEWDEATRWYWPTLSPAQGFGEVAQFTSKRLSNMIPSGEADLRRLGHVHQIESSSAVTANTCYRLPLRQLNSARPKWVGLIEKAIAEMSLWAILGSDAQGGSLFLEKPPPYPSSNRVMVGCYNHLDVRQLKA